MAKAKWLKKNLILQETTSKIDGSPIVVIATGLTTKSANKKTGAMVQVTIIRSDINPVEAIMQGKDFAVCGNCPHRAGGNVKERTCYVNVPKSVLSIFRAYKRGSYAHWDGDTSVFENRSIRWGAYGDPSLIDSEIVASISAAADMYTGYTHQWDNPIGQEYRAFFQASCDSVAQKAEAQNDGWGTFTVLPIGFDVKTLGKVTICPASIDESVQCINCGKCDGAKKVARQVVIEAHGKGAEKVQWAAD